ncbi:MAG: glycosyltransferase family 39 protein [Defluviitaleaceae bacterium]|nr:glycosyltransferase family 39 protein [Defluviitaleaceae bacterium]
MNKAMLRNKIIGFISRINLDTVIALMLAFLMYAISSQFSSLGIDFHHDGIILKPAIDVLNGQVLFRDTFTQYGAFLTFLQAITMAIFGAELLIIRLQTAFMYAVTVFFIYKCWRYFLPTGVTIVSSLLFIGMAHFFVRPQFPWSSVYAMALVSIVIFLLFKFIESKNHYYVLFAGIVSALAFYTRQPVGIVLFIAILFLLVNYGLFTFGEIKNIKKYVFNFLLGFFIVYLIFSLYFLITGAFYDWFAQSLRFAFFFGFGGQFGTIQNLMLDLFFGGHWTFRGAEISMIWVIMPVVCIFLFFNFYAGRFVIRNMRIKIRGFASHKDMMLLFFVVIGIASWHQYYPVACISHAYWANGIMIGIFVYTVWDAFGDAAVRRKAILLIMVLFVFFYSDLNWKVRTGTAQLRGRAHLATIDFGFHLNGMSVDHGSFGFLLEYFTFIEQLKELLPDKQFINYTRDGLLGITHGDNMINMTVNWGNIVYPDYHVNVHNLINTHQPIVVATHHIGSPGYVLVRQIHHVLIYVDADSAREHFPHEYFMANYVPDYEEGYTY